MFQQGSSWVEREGVLHWSQQPDSSRGGGSRADSAESQDKKEENEEAAAAKQRKAEASAQAEVAKARRVAQAAARAEKAEARDDQSVPAALRASRQGRGKGSSNDKGASKGQEEHVQSTTTQGEREKEMMRLRNLAAANQRASSPSSSDPDGVAA